MEDARTGLLRKVQLFVQMLAAPEYAIRIVPIARFLIAVPCGRAPTVLIVEGFPRYAASSLCRRGVASTWQGLQLPAGRFMNAQREFRLLDSDHRSPPTLILGSTGFSWAHPRSRACAAP